MSQTITVTYISPGVFPWTASDSNAGTFAGGTATTVISAGSAAVVQVRAFLATQGSNTTALSTGL